MRFRRSQGQRFSWDCPAEIGRLVLRNPVIASAGTFGYGLEYEWYGDMRQLGAVIMKSLTVDPRPGFAPPRVTLLNDPPGSMRNAIGVPNPGVRAWAEETLPSMLALGAPVVASLWGVEEEAVLKAADLLSKYRGPIAWEVNLSCPNSEHEGLPVCHDPVASARVCREVRRLAPDDVGVWAKLSPDAPGVVEVGVACFDAGADAVTISNSLPASHDDLIGQSRLGGGAGGLSGPVLMEHVRPLIEKFTSSHPEVPIVACGGVTSSRIALDYLDLGARAVQIGTASLYDPRACYKIAKGVVTELTGRMK